MYGVMTTAASVAAGSSRTSKSSKPHLNPLPPLSPHSLPYRPPHSAPSPFTCICLILNPDSSILKP